MKRAIKKTRDRKLKIRERNTDDSGEPSVCGYALVCTCMYVYMGNGVEKAKGENASRWGEKGGREREGVQVGDGYFWNVGHP